MIVSRVLVAVDDSEMAAGALRDALANVSSAAVAGLHVSAAPRR